MNKMIALLSLFRKGAVVAEPSVWKNRQVTATVLGGIIIAFVNVLAAFGYAIPIGVDAANAIAAGIIAIVNVVLTITTTDKIGLPEKQQEATQENKQSVSERIESVLHHDTNYIP